MPELPRGTVTFLLTDIEGSTRLWQTHHEAMVAAYARHDTILRNAIDTHGGVVFNVVGDALQVAFPTAPSAVTATLALQGLAILAVDNADLQLAETLHREALALARAGGDQRLLALVLGNYADCAAVLGDHDLAVALLEEGLSLLRPLGLSAMLASHIDTLGSSFFKRGDLAQASLHFRESLSLSRDLGLG